MACLKDIKIYEDGTMIAITTKEGNPIAAEPFGNVRLKPFGTQGFSFIRVSTNETIADIKDFRNVLNSQGLPYNSTYLSVFSHLNEFLNKQYIYLIGENGEAISRKMLSTLENISEKINNQSQIINSLLTS